MGGFITGLLSPDDKKKQQVQKPDMASTGQTNQIQTLPDPSQNTNSATPAVASSQSPSPINTQQQQQGFHGVVPMISNYISNYQAKVRDASAQPHIDALQNPNTTPEQRQYHLGQLQQTYSNHPDVLHRMGISVPGAYNVPSIQPVNLGQKMPAATMPAVAQPVNLGQQQTSTSMRVMDPTGRPVPQPPTISNFSSGSN